MKEFPNSSESNFSDDFSNGDYSRYYANSVTCKSEYISTNAGVSLRIISFSPTSEHNLPPMVLIHRLAGVIDSFKDLLFELTQKYTVYYLETREKGTAQIAQPVGFSGSDIAADIAYAFKRLAWPISRIF